MITKITQQSKKTRLAQKWLMYCESIRQWSWSILSNDISAGNIYWKSLNWSRHPAPFM